MKHLIKMSLHGLKTNDCAATIDKALIESDGIHKTNIDFEDSSVEIEYNDAYISFEQIRDVIQNIGYEVI